MADDEPQEGASPQDEQEAYELPEEELAPPADAPLPEPDDSGKPLATPPASIYEGPNKGPLIGIAVVGVAILAIVVYLLLPSSSTDKPSEPASAGEQGPGETTTPSG